MAIDKDPPDLAEGVDYTVDPGTGRWIFTADYLKRRGYCCKSGCRNCPYGFEPDSTS